MLTYSSVLNNRPGFLGIEIQDLVSSGLFFHRFSGINWKWNFLNLEFREKILEFSKKSFHFDGGNLEFPLSLVEKVLFFGAKPLSLEKNLSLDFLEFSEKWWKNKPGLNAKLLSNKIETK